MEIISQFFDHFRHLDDRLASIISTYGTWTYLILFTIIFLETGVVIAPFLPGDPLLFTAGILAGRGALNLTVLMVVLVAAAILGDTVNYWIGKFVGPKVFHSEKSRFFKKEHLHRTHAFFEKYGGKTVIIARFVPIVRTFAPFVAGIGAMTYSTFLFYNVIGALLWVTICVLAGYFFGGLQIVKDHFELVVLAIIAVSVLPMVFEMVKARKEAKQQRLAAEPEVERV